MRLPIVILGALATLCSTSWAAETSLTSIKSRTLSFNYNVTIPAEAIKNNDAKLFLPVAQDDQYQKISKVEYFVDGKQVAASLKTESTYGNKFWQPDLPEYQKNKDVKVSVRYEFDRVKYSNTDFAKSKQTSMPENDLKKFESYLKSNKKVPVNSDFVAKVLADIPFKDPTMIGQARAIYDYVVDNMEYKKVGKGWGNGDTFWACTAKYGNCTDFHALFNSLARSKKIPARFEIGFPIPADRPSGKIGGYHCWVTFYIPELGWVPIDASEAKKNPAMRTAYFGTHPADRIKFSIGRDLQLGADQKDGTLNYFVYPHLEIAGKKSDQFSTEFSFTEKARVL